MSHVVITVQVRRSRQLTTGMVQGRTIRMLLCHSQESWSET
jgi:hypothetical protein